MTMPEAATIDNGITAAADGTTLSSDVAAENGLGATHGHSNGTAEATDATPANGASGSHYTNGNGNGHRQGSPRLPYRLDGKTAIVTGSGRGIGAAMATELGRCGANVVVNYAKSADRANKVADEIKAFGVDAIAVQADIRDVSQIGSLFKQAIEYFGKIDIVCSNSGVVSFGHLEDVTEVSLYLIRQSQNVCSWPLTYSTQEEFDRVFSLNTRGQFFVAREAYKHLGPGGRIILMSSNTTRDKIVPNHSVYAGSKGAIESFVRCMALDCGRKKITVNAVAPGATVTDMFHETVRLYVPNGKNMSDEEIEKVSLMRIDRLRCGIVANNHSRSLPWQIHPWRELVLHWTWLAWCASLPVQRVNGSMERRFQ